MKRREPLSWTYNISRLYGFIQGLNDLIATARNKESDSTYLWKGKYLNSFDSRRKAKLVNVKRDKNLLGCENILFGNPLDLLRNNRWSLAVT